VVVSISDIGSIFRYIDDSPSVGSGSYLISEDTVDASGWIQHLPSIQPM